MEICENIKNDNSGKNDYIKSKEKRNMARKLEKQINDTEKRISVLEAELSENMKMQEENSCDYKMVKELFDRYQQIEDELEKLYEFLDNVL